MPGYVGLLVAIGMVVVVPLALRLLYDGQLAALQRAWPLLGLLAALGLLLPRGGAAVATAVPYALASAAVTLHGLRAALPQDATPAQATDRLVRATATTSLSIAAGCLLSERAGYRALGFDLDVLGLTVAHFTFAGFAAVLLAGLTAQAAPSRIARVGAVALPTGTAIVAAGYIVGEAGELVGALVVTVALLCTSWVLLRQVAPTCDDRAGRALLHAAALATPFSMALALWWAAGELTGVPHPSLALMAATHGTLNALAVALGGLLGFHLLVWKADHPLPAASEGPGAAALTASDARGQPTEEDDP